MSEGSIPVDGASLHYRDVGQGLPIVVVHGGPDFDHRYLLPDLDRLADSFRLIYYDQHAAAADPPTVFGPRMSPSSQRSPISNGCGPSSSSKPWPCSDTRGAGSWHSSMRSATPIGSPTSS